MDLFVFRWGDREFVSDFFDSKFSVTRRQDEYRQVIDDPVDVNLDEHACPRETDHLAFFVFDGVPVRVVLPGCDPFLR